MQIPDTGKAVARIRTHNILFKYDFIFNDLKINDQTGIR